MKPKIQLAGGCASSFENEVVIASVKDSSKSSVSKSNEARLLLDEMLATIITALDANAGLLRTLSRDGKEFSLIASSGLPEKTNASARVVDAGCGAYGSSIKTHSITTSEADFWKNRFVAEFSDEACQYVLVLPLEKDNKENQENVPEAVLVLFFATEQRITDEIQRAIPTYVELLRISLKNLLQNEKIHQSNLLAERQSIANEIHDSLAQTLYYAKIRASLLLDAMKSDNDLLAFKCAQDINEALEGSQKTVRELVTHFRCQMDPRGLKYALEKLAKDFIVRTNIPLVYENLLDEINLPLEFELQIFLILREALVNIATHSGANHARLMVSRSYNQYQFTVEDDGAGVGSGIPPEGHYGLEIMRERALRIGGMVEIENLEKMGTRVQLIFSAPAT